MVLADNSNESLTAAAEAVSDVLEVGAPERFEALMAARRACWAAAQEARRAA